MFGPPIDRCRSAGGPRHALAALLRRLVLRLDPAPPEPPKDLVWISRSELREVQTRGLRMVAGLTYLTGSRGPNEGLIWFSRDELESILWIFGEELNVRDRDFARIESDPTAVWQ